MKKWLKEKNPCFLVKPEIEGNYLYLILIKTQIHHSFYSYIHPTSTDWALASTKGWPTVVEHPQTLKFCLPARFMSGVSGKSPKVLTSGQAFLEVMELNWEQNCFFPSYWIEWGKMRVAQCVGAWEQGEGRKGREGNIYWLQCINCLSIRIRLLSIKVFIGLFVNFIFLQAFNQQFCFLSRLVMVVNIS